MNQCATLGAVGPAVAGTSGAPLRRSLFLVLPQPLVHSTDLARGIHPQCRDGIRAQIQGGDNPSNYVGGLIARGGDVANKLDAARLVDVEVLDVGPRPTSTPQPPHPETLRPQLHPHQERIRADQQGAYRARGGG